MNVWYSSRENAELSNLAYRPFRVNGLIFLSVEHAYQSLKGGRLDRLTYGKYTGPGKKIRGMDKPKTEDGYNIKLMKFLIKRSFEMNFAARLELLKTGDEEITHYQDKSIWRNLFPKLLMEVREELTNK